jgi:hypothetical protein
MGEWEWGRLHPLAVEGGDVGTERVEVALDERWQQPTMLPGQPGMHGQGQREVPRAREREREGERERERERYAEA